jgi:hypothetical protein
MSESTPATNDALLERAGRLRENQVFGPVVERNGVAVVPVAHVRGGGGLGGPGGRAPHQSNGGFGFTARPAGAWVIDGEGKVTWNPAVDVTRIAFGGQLVEAVALLLVALVLRRAGELRYAVGNIHNGFGRGVHTMSRGVKMPCAPAPSRSLRGPDIVPPVPLSPTMAL